MVYNKLTGGNPFDKSYSKIDCCLKRQCKEKSDSGRTRMGRYFGFNPNVQFLLDCTFCSYIFLQAQSLVKNIFNVDNKASFPFVYILFGRFWMADSTH